MCAIEIGVVEKQSKQLVIEMREREYQRKRKLLGYTFSFFNDGKNVATTIVFRFNIASLPTMKPQNYMKRLYTQKKSIFTHTHYHKHLNTEKNQIKIKPL